MDQDTQNKMAALEAKIDSIYESVEKTRKYFLWTTIATLAAIILPIVALLFIIPNFLKDYTSALDGLL